MHGLDSLKYLDGINPRDSIKPKQIVPINLKLRKDPDLNLDRSIIWMNYYFILYIRAT